MRDVYLETKDNVVIIRDVESNRPLAVLNYQFEAIAFIFSKGWKID